MRKQWVPTTELLCPDAAKKRDRHARSHKALFGHVTAWKHVMSLRMKLREERITEIPAVIVNGGCHCVTWIYFRTRWNSGYTKQRFYSLPLLVFRTQDGSKYVPPTRWYLSASPDGVTTQKTNIDITSYKMEEKSVNRNLGHYQVSAKSAVTRHM
jgi:hypothetical protein